jgi:hypothetical protein
MRGDALSAGVQLFRPLMNPIRGRSDSHVQAGLVQPPRDREAYTFGAARTRHNGDLPAHVHRRSRILWASLIGLRIIGWNLAMRGPIFGAYRQRLQEV